MSNISAAAVRQLRELTDMPMMKCKEALVEAEGDQDRAIEILKQEAGRVMIKRAENATSEGRIFTRLTDDGTEAAMIEIQCESAPVGSGEHLAQLGEALITQLLDGPGASTADELLDQPVPGGSESLRELYERLVGTIREKIVISRLLRVPGPAGCYVHHDGKTGVVFQAAGESKTAEVLRDVAMHIAAMRSSVVSPEDLPEEKVAAERDRLSAEAKATGKPDNIIEKIVDGRMKTFFVEEGVLSMQPFVKEESKTVSQALAEQGLQPVAFTRWVIGVGT